MGIKKFLVFALCVIGYATAFHYGPPQRDHCNGKCTSGQVCIKGWSSYCKPVTCQGLNCTDVGEFCEMRQKPRCWRPPCEEPVCKSVCGPSSCAPGEKCQPVVKECAPNSQPKDCWKAQCLKDDCTTKNCTSTDEKCIMETTRCRWWANCPQVPRCVAKTCSDITCPANEICHMKRQQCGNYGNCPAKAECINPNDPCSRVQCRNDDVCKLQDRHFCFNPPCPKQARCLPKTCDDVNCTLGQICKMEKQCQNPWGRCPPKPICLPPPPTSCAAVTCHVDKVCKVKDDVASCFDKTCEDLNCTTGEKCELERTRCNQRTCPPKPVCKPDPCASVTTCSADEKCVANVHWGRVTTSCVPKTCKDLNCNTGEKCVKEPTVCNRSWPPCPEKVVCKTDLCYNFTCPVGDECVVIQPHCATTPCPPIATCKKEDKCEGRCRPWEVCEMRAGHCPWGQVCAAVVTPTCVRSGGNNGYYGPVGNFPGGNGPGGNFPGGNGPGGNFNGFPPYRG